MRDLGQDFYNVASGTQWELDVLLSLRTGVACSSFKLESATANVLNSFKLILNTLKWFQLAIRVFTVFANLVVLCETCLKIFSLTFY